MLSARQAYGASKQALDWLVRVSSPSPSRAADYPTQSFSFLLLLTPLHPLILEPASWNEMAKWMAADTDVQACLLTYLVAHLVAPISGIQMIQTQELGRKQKYITDTHLLSQGTWLQLLPRDKQATSNDSETWPSTPTKRDGSGAAPPQVGGCGQPSITIDMWWVGARPGQAMPDSRWT